LRPHAFVALVDTLRSRHIVATTTSGIVYQHLAPLYDTLYGSLLQPGRRSAMAHLAPRPGESILEVGVGTGFSLRAYPTSCRVVGIDLSAAMLVRAAGRQRTHGLAHVSLCRMDATRLGFADGRFDAVYAPYCINVVPDPLRVVREMRRVCRDGGRIVLLNHFEDLSTPGDAASRLAGRIAVWFTGVNRHLCLAPLLDQTGLAAESVEFVNLRGVSSVVLCRKV
jgi:phosphatidylethanolamine/phosphatidyl-N-methylethanolamine N-methyltransferase